MEKKRPPSASLAAQYLTQHRCIYFAENATRMCGLPVSRDHPHYCEAHAKASTIDWIRRFAELYLTDTSPEESQPDVVLASTISGR